MKRHFLAFFVLLFFAVLADGHRYDLLRTYFTTPRSQKQEKNYTYDSLRNVERTYTRLRTDANFHDEAHGIKNARIVSANGQELDRAAFMRYIPLIPTEYWKNQK